MPVPDKTQWLRTTFPDVDPSRFTVQPGRPKKKRRKAPGERHVPSRSSKRVAIRCSRCKGFGHNVSRCKMRKSVENRVSSYTSVSTTNLQCCMIKGHTCTFAGGGPRQKVHKMRGEGSLRMMQLLAHSNNLSIIL